MIQLALLYIRYTVYIIEHKREIIKKKLKLEVLILQISMAKNEWNVKTKLEQKNNLRRRLEKKNHPKWKDHFNYNYIFQNV